MHVCIPIKKIKKINACAYMCASSQNETPLSVNVWGSEVSSK